jgi:1-phosphatidylinositol-3-phosphate 5-kinase
MIYEIKCQPIPMANAPMDSSLPAYSPVPSSSSRSRSSTTKLEDSITSLTSFNPFSEEDENDQSSYTLVTSLFSRVKNSLAAPLSAVASASSNVTSANAGGQGHMGTNEPRRPSLPTTQNSQSTFSSHRLSYAADRPNSLTVVPSNLAPPLVSLTPVVSEAPSFITEYDGTSRNGNGGYTPVLEGPDGGVFGTSIPGFPIQDDARSIRTSGSLNRSGSVSKVIRRIRGEGARLHFF